MAMHRHNINVAKMSKQLGLATQANITREMFTKAFSDGAVTCVDLSTIRVATPLQRFRAASRVIITTVWWYKGKESLRGSGRSSDGGFQPWFFGPISRDEADAQLRGQPPGTFLVRLSSSGTGYSLSFIDKSHVSSHLRVAAKDSGNGEGAGGAGYILVGNSVTHTSLGALVEYHGTMSVKSDGVTLKAACPSSANRADLDVLKSADEWVDPNANAASAPRRQPSAQSMGSTSRQIRALSPDSDYDGFPDSRPPMYVKLLDLDEFDRLEQNYATESDVPRGVDDLNRYPNVLPNAATRVALSAGHGDARASYINANWVASHDGKNPRAYIATQGPTAESIDSFWRMVWEHNAGAIVMVTGITESGVDKCIRYWPAAMYDRATGTGQAQFGSVGVRVVAAYRKEGFIVSELQLRNTRGAPRTVLHVWFDSPWPDHNVPELAAPVLSMVETVRKMSPGYDKPWVVHCSAGLGRTGTVLAIDHGINTLRATGGSGVVDILETVQTLRRCRGGCVQRAVQAEFIRECLESFAEQNGSEHTAAQLDEEVLHDSVRRAMQQPSNASTSEWATGFQDAVGDGVVPAWRTKQIDERKREEAAADKEDLVFLTRAAPGAASRRMKRNADKRAQKGAAVENAFLMLEQLQLQGGDTPQTSTRTRSLWAHVKPLVRRISAAHATVGYGSINSDSYLALAGEFDYSEFDL